MKKSSLLLVGVSIILLALLGVGGLAIWPKQQRVSQTQSPLPSPDRIAFPSVTQPTPQDLERKKMEWQKATADFFTNYDSCLPRHISPRQLKENDYPYDYMVELIICSHDSMKTFAKEIDNKYGTDFTDSLRFGTCDECSESH